MCWKITEKEEEEIIDRINSRVIIAYCMLPFVLLWHIGRDILFKITGRECFRNYGGSSCAYLGNTSKGMLLLQRMCLWSYYSRLLNALFLLTGDFKTFHHEGTK